METTNGNKNGHSANGHSYSFGRFVIDTTNRVVVRDGESIALTGKVFDVLVVFAENPGRLLKKDELIEQVWMGSFVEEGNLARNVSTIRKALGDELKPHKIIETVPGHGYRFIAELVTNSEPSGSPVTEVRAPNNVFPGILRRRPFLVGAVAVLMLLAFGFAISKIPRAAKTFQLPASLSMSRLTNSGNVIKVALSPDGKLIAFVSREKSGESLSIRQVGMGNDVIIIPPIKGTFINITFSPDGNLVYYSIFSGGGSQVEFFSIPILGGMSHVVQGEPTGTMSFAPDGRHFAHIISSSNRGDTSLVVRDNESGEDRLLASRRYPSEFNGSGQACSWSPDGRRIAVISNEVDATGHFSSIVLVDPSDGAEASLLAKRWNYLESVQWLHDGSGLLATGSDAPQAPSQIWLIDVNGQARRLTNDLSNYSDIGATNAGQPVVGIQESHTSSIWEVSIVQKGSDSRELISGVGTMAPLVATPDRRIVYRSNAGDGSNLWTAAADGSDKRQLTADAVVDSRGLSSTPDGKYMFFPSGKAGRTNIWRASIDGGDLERITDGDNEIFPSCTPDGRFVIYQRGAGDGFKTSLWKVSIDGGDPVHLTDYFSVRAAVSPDGKHIAFFFMTDEKWLLGIVSINGGDMEQSIELPDGLVDRIARWSPDGRSLLIVANAGDVGNIWRIPLNGGPSVRITSFDRLNIEDFVVSPDGRQLSITRTSTVSDVIIASAN